MRSLTYGKNSTRALGPSRTAHLSRFGASFAHPAVDISGLSITLPGRRTSPSIGTLIGLDLDRHGAVQEPRAMCGLAGPERPPGMGVPPDRRSLLIFHLPNPYSGVCVKTRVAIVL